MALDAEERRGKLRKATGSRKQALIRGSGGKERKIDFVSSGERKRRSPNHPTTVGWGCGPAEGRKKSRRRVLERTSKEGKRPVSERLNPPAGTRVPQDTRNPVGSRGDHPPRLNTNQ